MATTKKHRLVVMGDSLSQGFMSGAIHRTDISFPRMIADALGIRESFNHPDFSGEGGLPLNLELILNDLGEAYGSEINWWEVLPLAVRLRSRLDGIEDYWERGKGSRAYPRRAVHHNLAVWGFEAGDASRVTEGVCRREIPTPRDNVLKQTPEIPMYRTARRVLNPTFANDAMEWSQVRCARELAGDGGIENLIVYLGANNAFGTVTSLNIKYSEPSDLHRLPHERTCNLYLPEHFDILLSALARDIDSLAATNVFVGTVPHVTIPPATRGVSPDGTLDGGHFEYYTRPWVWDDDFDPEKHPHLTRDQARRVDDFIDGYNKIIRREAKSRGWHVCDTCGQLDKIAYRRQGGKPKFKFPSKLVRELRDHGPLNYLVENRRAKLDTRFFACDSESPARIAKGGLFSLDGIHPTTIGYGLVADEFIKVMQTADVEFAGEIDWKAVVRGDTLVNSPPVLMSSLRTTLELLDKHGLLSSVLDLF